MNRREINSGNHKRRWFPGKLEPLLFLLLVAGSLILASCSSFPGRLYTPPARYTIGGMVSGLSGAGLVLRNNGGNDLSVGAGATSFTFTQTIASGGSFNVTVSSQPSNSTQTCVVTNSTGVVANTNITSVQVTCATNSYTIGGTISGLTGNGLVLQDNGADNLPVAAGATSFTFTTPILSGGGYSVSVFSQPSNPTQTCVVTNGTGVVANTNITSVQVTCTTNSYTIGGTISGLTGNGLVLQDNGADSLPVAAGATSFTFTTPVQSGGGYSVSTFSQPSNPTQTCLVTNGSGIVVSANVTNVQIICSTNVVPTFAYVSNQSDNTISAYKVAADGTLTALAGSPYAAGQNPAGVAVDPTGTFLYAANVLSNNVSGYLIASDGSLTPISGSPFPAASGAISVAIDPTGKYLYVPSCGFDCSGSGLGSVPAFTITPGTGVLVPVPTSPFAAGTFPYEMAFGIPGISPPGSTFAYAGNLGSNNVSAYSIQSTGALSAVSGSPFATGNGPLALSVDAGLSRLFVVNTFSNDLSVYAIHLDGSLAQIPGSTTPTGALAASAAYDGNLHVYVAGGSGVFGFTENNFPLTPIAGSPFPAGTSPNCVRVAPGGKFLYVVNENSNNISAYSIDSSSGILTLIGTFPAGHAPYSIAITGTM